MRVLYASMRLTGGIKQKDLRSVYFPSMKNSFYWSSTAYEVYQDRVLVVFFNDGNVGHTGKNDANYARCVRR